MIQRSVLRASRQIAPRISQRSFITPPRPSSAFTRLPALYPSSTRLSPRWYSDSATAPKDETKSDDTSKSSESASSESSSQPSEIQTLKADLESKNKEIIDLKDKYLRAIADYRNLQDRTKREVQAARDFALQKFSQDLIASIDTFEHALSSVPAERVSPSPSPTTTTTPSDSSAPTPSAEALQADLQSLHKGLQLTETMLLDTLKRHGLVRFDPAETGERFDPNVHEAVFQAPVPGKEDGTVFMTQQKGFMLNGRVIRAPKVGVVKNP